MAAFLVLIAMIAILLLCLHFYAVIFDRKLSHIPGPVRLPILGNALDLGKDAVEVTIKLRQLAQRYGSIYRIWIGPVRPFVIFSNPDHIEAILTSQKHIDKSEDYRYFKSWLGDGLLLSTGKKWQQHRKILTPAFHFSILKNFVAGFNSASDILVERLTKEVDNKTFDVYPYITACALDIICDTAMGTNINAQGDSTSDYVKAVRTVCSCIHDRSISAWRQFDILFHLSPDGFRYRKAVKILHDKTNSVIESRRMELENKQNINVLDTSDEYGIKERHAFLDLLLQATVNGEPLSNEDIRSEVDTFMFEGHDTVSSGLGFACYLLAKHPHIQDKVFAEMRQIFGDDQHKESTYENLQHMKYLDLVIKETLRLYPSVPFIARHINEAFTLGDGTRIPANITAFLYISRLQTDPKLFQDPDAFNPDRFLDERNANNVYSYVPFSAGPRNCIGQRFAVLEMKAAISKIIRNFELLPPVEDYKLEIESAVILKSRSGIPVRITHRKY